VPETRASIRYLRTSPSKVREVLGLIRGREIDDARERLRFCERGPAGDVLKLLDSAVANAESNDNLPEDELFVARAYADEGPTLKRWRPRARGRGTRIRKRTSHVTIVVSRFSDEELERRRRREASEPTRRRLRRPTRRRRAREVERAEAVDRELEEAEEPDHEHAELGEAEEPADVSAADEEPADVSAADEEPADVSAADEEAEEDGEDVALADVPDVGDDAVPLGQAEPVEPAVPEKGEAPTPAKKAPATKKPTKKATTAKKPTAKKAKSTKKTTKKKKDT
jgi:large subunit ribosomal protein L22